jgi:2-polyprenyl-3-methyl-5-hydroxy-6-metoxy-1,4-benzoquinol methylase
MNPFHFSKIGQTNVYKLPDFLSEAAQLTREWAPESCFPSNIRHQGCEHYHGAWSTLRLIGVITGARTDKDFFYQQFTKLARYKPNARVLIAGTADHAMLHMLMEVFKAHGGHPRVTVVDACETTLRLNHWYAKKSEFEVTCTQSDLREINDTTLFDLIVTHSVFSFMELDDVTKALKSWRNLLSEGGGLSFVQAIRPDLHSKYIVFSDNQVAQFISRAEKHWAKYPATFQLDQKTVMSLAEKFALHKKNYAIASSKQIFEAISKASWSVKDFTEINRHHLNYQSSSSDPNEQAFSLRIIAQPT